MAKKKESTAKKVGRFVTDELLGIDDAKRAVSKAKKGDIKGALKSAGAAVLEVGTTATAVGKGGMLAGKVAGKAVAKEAEKTSAKVADKVAQKVAENAPKPKLGKKGGEIKTVRTNPKSEVTVRRDIPGDRRVTPGKVVSVDKPKSATYMTRENSMKQRIAVEKRMADKRVADIESAYTASKSAAKKPVQKALATNKAKSTAQGAIAAKAAVRLNEKDKKKKGK